MEQVATDLAMTLEFDRGTGDNRLRRKGRSHVTVLGTPLKSAAVAAIAGRIADTGANIDRIGRMARYPITAIDLPSPAPTERLRTILAREAVGQGIDVAVQPAACCAAGKRLIVMDVDSTLIQGEVIEMLAAHAGCEAEVARVTEQAMRGELDFAECLRARVALLEGLSQPRWTGCTTSSCWPPAPGRRCARSSGSATGSHRQRWLHPAHRPACR